jgi:hypothetical protein
MMNTIRNYTKALVCVVILGLASLSASAQENYVMKIWHDGAVTNQYPTTLVDSVTFELGNPVDPGNPVSDYPYLWIANLDDNPNDYLLGYYQYMARTDAYTYSINFYAPANNTPVVFVPAHSLSGDKIGISPQSGDLINSSNVLPIILPEKGYYEIDVNLDQKTYHINKYTPSAPSYSSPVKIVRDYFGWGDDYKLDRIDDWHDSKAFTIPAGQNVFYLRGAQWDGGYFTRWLPGEEILWNMTPETFCGLYDEYDTRPVGEDGAEGRMLDVTFEAREYTFTYDKETRWFTISTKH